MAKGEAEKKKALGAGVGGDGRCSSDGESLITPAKPQSEHRCSAMAT